MSDENQRRLDNTNTVLKRLIKVLLREGYALSVNDGEEDTLVKSTDASAIFKAMQTTDEDYLRAHAGMPGGTFADRGRSIHLVYGNEAYEVISDHSVSLEDIINPVTEWAEKKFG